MLDWAQIDIDCKFARMHDSNLMRFYSCDNPKSKQHLRMTTDNMCASCKVRASKHQTPAPVKGPVNNQMNIEDWEHDARTCIK